MNKVVPRRVDFTDNNKDILCVKLGAQGLSTKYIMKATGYSFCQVSYRLGLAEISRADFRNGRGRFVKAFIKITGDEMERQLRLHLKTVFAPIKPIVPRGYKSSKK
jgi:hypothetical protein